jgi:hypothetical protein
MRAYLPGGQPLGPLLHEQAENGEPVILSERGQSLDCNVTIHKFNNTTIFEISK